MKRSLKICKKCGYFINDVYPGTFIEQAFNNIKYFKCSGDIGVFKTKENFEKQWHSANCNCPYAFEHDILCQDVSGIG